VAKKDLDNFCNGKITQPHLPKITKGGRFLGDNSLCRWVGKVYVCTHYISCGECGRVLKYEWQMKKEDCPDFHE